MRPWKPLGPFAVAYCDIDYSKNIEGALEAETHVVGRLFYPAGSTSSSERTVTWLSGVSWLPEKTYALGMATMLFFRRPKGIIYTLMRHFIFLLSWIFGLTQKLALKEGQQLARPFQDEHARLPLIIFSHGLGGCRCVYSIICMELASQGYLVFAVEHADGTSCATRLALKEPRWRVYAGIGDETSQVSKTRYRVAEIQTALMVFKALDAGRPLPGTKYQSSISFLRNRIDWESVAAVGHSYGGATVAALCAVDDEIRCGISLDPWWPALFPDTAALNQSFDTNTPLLVIGSHDWNIPNVFGQILCGPERQMRVLKAAAKGGGGSMLLVLEGTSHNSFADALPLFGSHLGWFLEKLGLTARLDPVLAIHLISLACLNFLSLHLPVKDHVRQLQTFDGLMKEINRIETIDALESTEEKRGLLYRLSDMGLDMVLQSSTKKSTANGKASDGNDMVTGEEVLESMLPSQVHVKYQQKPGRVLPDNRYVGGQILASAEEVLFKKLLGEEWVFKCESYS